MKVDTNTIQHVTFGIDNVCVDSTIWCFWQCRQKSRHSRRRLNYLSNSRRCLTIVFGWKKLGWKKKVNAAKNMHEIYLKHCLHTSNPPGTTTTHTTTNTPFLPFPRTTSQHNNGSNAKIIIHNKKIYKINIFALLRRFFFFVCKVWC